jgi:hypothetical protein
MTQVVRNALETRREEESERLAKLEERDDQRHTEMKNLITGLQGAISGLADVVKGLQDTH